MYNNTHSLVLLSVDVLFVDSRITKFMLSTIACDAVILQIVDVDFNVSGGKARPSKMTKPIPGKAKKKKDKAAKADH